MGFFVNSGNWIFNGKTIIQIPFKTLESRETDKNPPKRAKTKDDERTKNVYNIFNNKLKTEQHKPH